MDTPICSECEHMFNCGVSSAARVYYHKNNECNSFIQEHFINNPYIEYSEVVGMKDYIKWKVEKGLI